VNAQFAITFGDPTFAIARANVSLFRNGFMAWLAVNVHVWIAFEREANRVWNRGRRHYSARTIGEVLRHESALAESGNEWKLNNVVFPDLARLYALIHPERAGLFEFRGREAA
jgi:hypothetical protein